MGDTPKDKTTSAATSFMEGLKHRRDELGVLECIHSNGSELDTMSTALDDYVKTIEELAQVMRRAQDAGVDIEKLASAEGKEPDPELRAVAEENRESILGGLDLRALMERLATNTEALEKAGAALEEAEKECRAPDHGVPANVSEKTGRDTHQK